MSKNNFLLVRKSLSAALGFAAGVFTTPLALVVRPLFLAWFMFNECDEA